MNELDKILNQLDTEPFTDVGSIYSKYHVEVHLKNWQYLKSDIERDFNKIIRKHNYSKFVIELIKVTYRQLKLESTEVNLYE